MDDDEGLDEDFSSSCESEQVEDPDAVFFDASGGALPGGGGGGSSSSREHFGQDGLNALQAFMQAWLALAPLLPTTPADSGALPNPVVFASAPAPAVPPEQPVACNSAPSNQAPASGAAAAEDGGGQNQ